MKDVTHSMRLDEMSVEELVQVSQGLGHEMERLRQKRIYLNRKIAERIAHLQPKQGGVEQAAAGDASAPGAVLEVSAKA